MITVTFHHDNRELCLEVKGHAGYAEHGKDIVCSSASILAYSLASIVEEFGTDPYINLESGNTTIRCVCIDDPKMDVIRDAFKYAHVGYELLEHSYPQYVRLEP